MAQINPPPVHTRFPVNRRDHTKKGKYLTPLIKKFLEKKITYEDPETQKQITGKVKDAIVWRLLLNACQGENEAIKEVFNRMDGKISDIIIDQSTKITYATFYRPEHYPKEKLETPQGSADRSV